MQDLRQQSEKLEAQSSEKIVGLQKQIHDLEMQLGFDQEESDAAVQAWQLRLKKLQTETGIKIESQHNELEGLRTKLRRMESEYDALLEQVVCLGGWLASRLRGVQYAA